MRNDAIPSSASRAFAFEYRDWRCFLILKTFAVVLFFEFLVSFRLWSGDKVFPQVPVADFIPVLPQPLGQWIAILTMGLLAIVILHPKEKICHRILLLFAGVWVFLMAQDWNRLHPFSFLSLIIYAGLAIYYFRGMTPDAAERVNNGFRLAVCSLYLWAGFWKINPEFFHEIIPVFLSPLTSALVKVTGPSEAVLTYIQLTYLAVPFVEMAVGVALFFPRTRYWGIILGGLMLAMVLICLGPWGVYTTSGIFGDVLSWNIFLFALDLILFTHYHGKPADMVLPASFYQKLVILFMGIMPLFSLAGWWPTVWSFRLWAGGIHRAKVEFNDKAPVAGLPAFIQDATIETNVIDVMAWSLFETNMTPMPIPKVYVAAAKRLCAYTADPDHMKLILYAPRYFWLVEEPEISVSYPCKDKGDAN